MNFKHGHKKRGKGTAEHAAWSAMKARCLNKNHKWYRIYGGRGITVCARWLNSFESFLEDMGPRPAGKSIERRNNNEGYNPTNCYWATRKEQSRNKRDNRLITCDGETHSVTEWAEKLNVPRARIAGRLRKGWSPERTIHEPKQKPRRGKSGDGTQSFAA